MANKIKEEDIVQGDLWAKTKASTEGLIKQVELLETALSKAATVAKEKLGLADEKDFNSLKKSNEQIDILNKALAAKIKLEKESVGLKATLAKVNAQQAASEKKAIDEVAKKSKAADDERLKNGEKIIAAKKKATADAIKLADKAATAEKKALESTNKERVKNNEKGLAGAKNRISARIKETKQRKASEKADRDENIKTSQTKAANAEKERLASLKLQKSRQAVANKVAAQNKRDEVAARKKKKLTLENANAFKRLSKQVNTAQARFKRLAAQYGQTDKRTQKALKTFNRLDSRLRSINKTAKDGRRDVGRYGTALSGIGTSFKNILKGLVIVQGIRAVGRAFTDAFKRVVAFDKELQNIAGITGQSRESLKDLETEIVSVSRSSIKTANEVAKLATVLFTLGKTKEEVKLLLAPVNDLSIAFGVSSESAADFLGQTLNAFGKGAEFASRFADIIANVRTSTSLDFERIKDGLGFLAPTASAMNLTLGETSALLGVLQDNGVRAARAGRLLNSSFARILDKGLTLNQALEKINKSQNKVQTSSKLFGKEALALGLILADNTEKTKKLSKEFDELSDGSLKELTDKQLDSLSAKITILDSNWESLILTIENGTGGLAKFFKGAVVGITNVVNNIRRANLSFQQKLAEDIKDQNKDFISGLNAQIREQITKKEQEKDALIAIEQSRLDRNLISKEQFNNQVRNLQVKFNRFNDGARSEEQARRDKDRKADLLAENVKLHAGTQSVADTFKNREAIEESYLKSIEGARNAGLRRTRDDLVGLVKEQSESISVATADAEVALEKLDIKRLKAEKEREAVIRATTSKTQGDLARAVKANVTKITEEDKFQKSTLISVIEKKNQIEIINLLLKQRNKIEPFDPIKVGAGGGEDDEVLIGLINKQAAVVAKTVKAINESEDEDLIIALGIQLELEKKELDRLRREAFSTREEFEKKQVELIEDRIDREIEAEVDKSEKIQQAIIDNEKATIEERKKLQLQESERLDRVIADKEVERGEIAIKRAADISRSEFAQKRSGFKTEAKFEAEKEEQFRAIKLKALEARLQLLQDYATKENKVEREKIKADIAALYQFGKERERIEFDLIELLQALNEKYFGDKLDKIQEEIAATKDRENELFQLAALGNEEAAASLGQNQKDQAEAAKKKEDLLQKEKQFELALAVIAAFNTELDDPENTTEEALTKAITSTTVLTSFVDSLPSFFDGTTDTGNSGSLDSNGGHVAMLHDNERVVDKKNNMKMGGVTNDDAATIVHDFNNDLLSYNTPQLVIKENRFDSNEQIIAKFDELSKDLVTAINNKETYLGSDIDTMKKMIMQEYSKGSTKTKVLSKYRTRQ